MEGVAMRGTIFLDFANPAQAGEAYSRLQQMPQFGEAYKKMRVEYAKPNPKRSTGRERATTTPSHSLSSSTQYRPSVPQTSHPSSSSPSPLSLSSPSSSSILPRQTPLPPKPVTQGEPVAPHLGINYPPNPDLHYRYPDPTPEILTNMMHAIASVPRLYVQTLHLMNKMNLPPPFGPAENDSIPAILSKKRKHDELVASDESELESDEERKDKEQEKQETRSKILAAQEQKRAALLQGKSSNASGSGMTSKKKFSEPRPCL
ncbi:hypothetical protein BDB00DRAFT_821103 [Zychaea mexicana]|uniref:uncharacterized protein n=1 Tax=Zychaea mexicana TaxID=64656 RepID=UPI0022FE7AD6|nr:uncharacterized protein BDB00DRAFT_821103 [Zychaea mexicana]KAI9493878.1 hypothetical protein BDB00DRAFT_821103 [Zychaea mexicana]